MQFTVGLTVLQCALTAAVTRETTEETTEPKEETAQETTEPNTLQTTKQTVLKVKTSPPHFLLVHLCVHLSHQTLGPLAAWSLGVLKQVFMPESDASSFFRRRSRRSAYYNAEDQGTSKLLLGGSHPFLAGGRLFRSASCVTAWTYATSLY